MAKVEVTTETSLAPEQVTQALLDFSDRRPDIWPGIDRSQYEVYSVDETSAHIKEGSKLPGMTIWAKEHYDWSEPGTVRWTVEESNFCAPGSYVLATMHPRPAGGTRIDIEWNRTGTTFGGRMAVRMIRLAKGKPVLASVEKTLRKLEEAPTEAV
jgi:hypothetical protein